jgi:hypothetical protein
LSAELRLGVLHRTHATRKDETNAGGQNTVIIFNSFALLISAISAGVAFAIVWLLSLGDFSIFWYDREWVVAMPIAIILDLALRRRAQRRWFDPHGGGHVFFLPVWLWGTVVLLFFALPDIISQKAARRCDLATVTVVRNDGRSPTQCAEWATSKQYGIIRYAVPGQYHEYSLGDGRSTIVCSCKAK